MMNYSCFIVFFLGSIALNAQRTSVTYMDQDGNPATRKNCYTYMVEKKTYNKLDTIVSYYCSSNKPQAVIEVNEKGEWNGIVTMYFENGNPNVRARFAGPVVFDTLTQWHEDGSLHYRRYLGTLDHKADRIIDYWDADGKRLVNGGSGYCKCSWITGSTVETGKVKDGLRDSLWTVVDPDSKLSKEVWYHKGSVVPRPANTNDSLQSLEVFSVVEVTARPTGGMASFYEFIGMNLRYPAQARRLGIEGKVFLEFIIEKDGSLSNPRVIKGIGGGCDEEAVRVVALSPAWIPGTQRGKPVRQKMVLPISFRLGGPKVNSRSRSGQFD